MSGDVATLQAAPAPAPVMTTTHNDGAVILSMLDKLIARPDVPVERVEQMYALYEKARKDAAQREYLVAFAALQAVLPTAARKGLGHNSKAYARYEDVANALRAPFAAHGFSHWFKIEQAGALVTVTTCLGHAAGHVETTCMSLPLDTSGGKTNMHAIGSTISYGKRYGLLTLTGIATEDDDDGKKAAPTGMITEAQLAELDALITAAGASRQWMLQHHSIEEFADMTQKDFQQAKAGLTAAVRRKQKEAKSNG